MAFIGQTSLADNRANTVLDGVACAPDVAIGNWVRMDSGTAVNALADNFNNCNVIGIVEAKIGSTSCTIRFLGQSDVVFSGLDEVREYYLSDTIPGGMTLIPPTDPGHVILKLGQPLSPTTFVVIKGIRMIRS